MLYILIAAFCFTYTLAISVGCSPDETPRSITACVSTDSCNNAKQARLALHVVEKLENYTCFNNSFANQPIEKCEIFKRIPNHTEISEMYQKLVELNNKSNEIYTPNQEITCNKIDQKPKNINKSQSNEPDEQPDELDEQPDEQPDEPNHQPNHQPDESDQEPNHQQNHQPDESDQEPNHQQNESDQEPNHQPDESDQEPNQQPNHQPDESDQEPNHQPTVQEINNQNIVRQSPQTSPQAKECKKCSKQETLLETVIESYRKKGNDVFKQKYSLDFGESRVVIATFCEKLEPEEEIAVQARVNEIINSYLIANKALVFQEINVLPESANVPEKNETENIKNVGSAGINKELDETPNEEPAKSSASRSSNPIHLLGALFNF